jgi:hypothetical protein
MAASIAKLSEKSVERAISDGHLSARREHGRVLIDEAKLRQWIEKRQVGGRRRAAPLASAFDYAKHTLALATQTDEQQHA